MVVVVVIIHHGDHDREEGFDLWEDDDDGNGDDVMIDECDEILSCHKSYLGIRLTKWQKLENLK